MVFCHLLQLLFAQFVEYRLVFVQLRLLEQLAEFIKLFVVELGLVVKQLEQLELLEQQVEGVVVLRLLLLGLAQVVVQFFVKFFKDLDFQQQMFQHFFLV